MNVDIERGSKSVIITTSTATPVSVASATAAAAASAGTALGSMNIVAAPTGTVNSASGGGNAGPRNRTSPPNYHNRMSDEARNYTSGGGATIHQQASRSSSSSSYASEFDPLSMSNSTTVTNNSLTNNGAGGVTSYTPGTALTHRSYSADTSRGFGADTSRGFHAGDAPSRGFHGGAESSMFRGFNRYNDPGASNGQGVIQNISAGASTSTAPGAGDLLLSGAGGSHTAAYEFIDREMQYMLKFAKPGSELGLDGRADPEWGGSTGFITPRGGRSQTPLLKPVERLEVRHHRSVRGRVQPGQRVHVYSVR